MFRVSDIKRYLLTHDNYLTAIISKVYTFIGCNEIKVAKGNKLFIDGNFLRQTRIIINGVGNEVQFGKNNHLISSAIIINGNNNVVRLGDGNSNINCEYWIEDDAGSIVLGDNNKILGKTHFAETEGKQIILGNDNLFSTNVVFRTGDSHSILDMDTGKRINSAESIIIGDRVWFGNNTTILKGASISNDTIVATGAIVTKKFNDANIILAGSLANIVKERIKWIAKRI